MRLRRTDKKNILVMCVVIDFLVDKFQRQIIKLHQIFQKKYFTVKNVVIPRVTIQLKTFKIMFDKTILSEETIIQ